MRAATPPGARARAWADGKNVASHFPRVVVSLAVGGTDIADANLRDSGDMRLLGGAAHRVSVPASDAVALVDEVQMGVYLQEVKGGGALAEGADAGDVDGMVAADDDGEGRGGEDFLDGGLDVGVAFFGVGVDDVGVADVDEAGALEVDVMSSSWS